MGADLSRAYFVSCDFTEVAMTKDQLRQARFDDTCVLPSFKGCLGLPVRVTRCSSEGIGRQLHKLDQELASNEQELLDKAKEIYGDEPYF